MNAKELKTYLQKEWRFCNHQKYQLYFEEWYRNITDTQKMYYLAWMKGDKSPFIKAN